MITGVLMGFLLIFKDRQHQNKNMYSAIESALAVERMQQT